jgi:hypothetical protein
VRLGRKEKHILKNSTRNKCLQGEFCMWCHEVRELEEQDKKLQVAKHTGISMNQTEDNSDEMNDSRDIGKGEEKEKKGSERLISNRCKHNPT